LKTTRFRFYYAVQTVQFVKESRTGEFSNMKFVVLYYIGIDVALCDFARYILPRHAIAWGGIAEV